MLFRLGAVFAFISLSLVAQTRLDLTQLRSFLKSSVDLHHPDKQVADFLRKAKLTQRLEPADFDEFIGMGVGARTIDVLREWLTTTKTLPAGKPLTAAAKPAAPSIPPPSPEEQRNILQQVREYALNYTKGLPNYICTQVTRRYEDPSGLEFWRNMDTVTTRLSYFEQKEDYKVITINGRPVDIPYSRLAGATSSGEFGSLMKSVFEAETNTQFQWKRWGTLRGRRNHVYGYVVAQPNSHWTIDYERKIQTTPGYHGEIFIERDTLQVTRITLDADIPPDFPVQQATTILDYDMIDISGNRFMLPLRSEMRMREGKGLVKNETEFRLYRRFGADTTITFDTPEPLPSNATQEQPATPASPAPPPSTPPPQH